MLRDYRRQTTLKLFAPMLKGKLDVNLSHLHRVGSCLLERSRTCSMTDDTIEFNLSFLSVSNSSTSDDDDDDDNDLDDPGSPMSVEDAARSTINYDEHRIKRIKPDPYILHKHLHGISSLESHLVLSDDEQELFDECRRSSYEHDTDYQARAIRPPSFSEHIQQLEQGNRRWTSAKDRSMPMASRNNKSNSLTIERQSNRNTYQQKTVDKRRLTSLHKAQSAWSLQAQPSMISTNKQSAIVHSRANSEITSRQLQSVRSCQLALKLNKDLQISSHLIEQIHEDVRNNKGKHVIVRWKTNTYHVYNE
jgi:hypothetical protein